MVDRVRMTAGPDAARGDYPYFQAIPTRWIDNDIYGHVNNVVYYSYFDTLISHYLIGVGGLDIRSSAVIGVAAETFCRFHAAIAHPDIIDAGLRVGHLGRRSVRYEIGLFRQNQPHPAATGHFVHVFVDRTTMRPVETPAQLRDALAEIAVSSES